MSGSVAISLNVSCNDMLNFNLISSTRLLCNGWNITLGKAAVMKLKTDHGGGFNLNIVVPTGNRAIIPYVDSFKMLKF